MRLPRSLLRMTSSSSDPPTPQGWPRPTIEGALEWYHSVPFATRTLLAVCTLSTLLCKQSAACFGLQTFRSGAGLMDIIWAFASSVFVHHGVLHWLFNGLALLSISTPIELAIGSSSLFGLISLFAVVNNLLFLFLEHIFAATLEVFPASCVIGISGILFSLMTFEAWGGSSSLAPHGERRVPPPPESTVLCGFLPIKTRLAPFALLLLMVILFPGSSFVMHVCGVASGLLVACATQTRQFLHFTGDCGRDSFCSRCRYFEDAPVEVGRSQTSAGNGDNSTATNAPSMLSSMFPSLPLVGPPKGFEAFKGTGRRLGGDDVV